MDQSSRQKVARLSQIHSDSVATVLRGASGKSRGGRSGGRSFSPRSPVVLFIAGILLCQILLPAALLAWSLDIPLPDEDYVSDQVGIVGEKSRAELKRLNEGLKPWGAQIVVAVIPSLKHHDIDIVANQTFRAWGLGDAEKNNGLLLLIAFNDKKFRIEVGRGLEGAITDARAGEILRMELAPLFKAERYDDGIYNAIRLLAGLTMEEYGGKFEDLDVKRPSYLDDDGSLKFMFGFFTLLIVFLYVFIKMRLMGYRHGVRDVPDGPASDVTISDGGDGYSGSSDSSGSGGSSGGGGGFSGGGGSSGGGGASGGW